MLLETERLTIRPIHIDDKNDIFNYRADSETNKYQGWIPKTIYEVETFIDKVSKQINEPQTWFQFVIIEKRFKK
jgi:RimJ/RimL family protein N-acetyltransferase